MPSRSKESILAVYQQAITILLIKAGLRPKLQCLDNEASAILQDFMTDQAIDFQLVPTHIHRRNAAERAIRTFKNHFIAGLCNTDASFPLHLWDRLLPQAMVTLNLFRGSRINPKTQPMHRSMELLISIELHLHHPAREFLCTTRNQTFAHPGQSSRR
eukprot:scaffold18746_cov41-Attheya_sp.AAC.5